MRRECEASLKRLKLDAIDLYQIHWPMPDEDIEEGWTAMARLKEEGKVRHIGVSNFNVEQIRRAQAIAPVTSLQPRYSLIHREIETELLPMTARENIGVIAYSPMGSGLLTGAMTPRAHSQHVGRRLAPRQPRLSRAPAYPQPATGGSAPGNRRPAWAHARRSRNRLGAAQVGRYRRHRGARRPGQVSGIIGAAQFRLSQAEIEEIEVFFKAN